MEQIDIGRQTQADIRSTSAAGTCGLRTVREILAVKGGTVHTIRPEASVFEALEQMSRFEVGALAVTESGHVRGVISERDYARKVILIGKSSRETQVREIMSSPARTISPEHTVADGLQVMTGRRVRHLPVIDGDRLVGLVSIGDLVQSVMADQEQRITQYERYVRGAYPA